MEIVFGWGLDGLVYPETVSGRSASFNALVAGPGAFLGLLETRLGLRRKPIQRAQRVAQYLAALQKIDDGQRFYSASLASDAWTTADHLLGIRDELIASGWNKQKIDGIDKLATFADVEKEAVLMDGPAERLRETNEALDTGGKPLIEHLRLIGPSTALPPIRRKTVASIEKSGTKVEEILASAKCAHGDLRVLQESLLASHGVGAAGDGVASGLTGDGSLVIIDADDEVQAATITAAWLAHRGVWKDIVIIRGNDCSLLDQACKLFNLPSPGNTARSEFKAISQVLPLAFEMTYRPLDPKKIVEFLSLQGGPIPAWISRKLIDALGRSPGLGGKLWHDAWQAATEMQARWIQSDQPELSNSEAIKQAAPKVEQWQIWFAASESSSQARTDAAVAALQMPQSHMTLKDAENTCNRIEQWAMTRTTSGDHADLYVVLAGQARMLRQLLTACGEARISLIQLRKMIQSVSAYGTSAISSAEAADWSLVDHPGQIWDAAPTVLWWGFSQPQGTVESTCIWSDENIAALTNSGIVLETTIEKLRRESYASRQAILNATERLILVKPRSVRGQAAMVHPLWDEIVSVLDANSLETVTVSAADAFANPALAFSATQMDCAPRDRVKLPGALRTWSLPANTARIRPKESYSSINMALGCPLAWVLQYGGGMYPPKALGLPEKQLLLGSLAHAVVKELFDERTDWMPADAQERATKIVPRLIPQIAAGLLLPGASPQLREASIGIPASMFQLTRFLQEAGVEVEGCEQSLSAQLNSNTKLEGFTDMLIRLPSGNRAVLDFKWSSSPYWYRKQLVEGRALQLAVYSWLLKQDVASQLDTSDGGTGDGGASDALPPAGYFMFRHSELFFTADGIFPAFTLVRKMKRDLDATWQAGLELYERTVAQLTSGTIIATGIADDTVALDDFANPVLVDPPCDFCRMGHFCGKKELL